MISSSLSAHHCNVWCFMAWSRSCKCAAPTARQDMPRSGGSAHSCPRGHAAPTAVPPPTSAASTLPPPSTPPADMPSQGRTASRADDIPARPPPTRCVNRSTHSCTRVRFFATALALEYSEKRVSCVTFRRLSFHLLVYSACLPRARRLIASVSYFLGLPFPLPNPRFVTLRSVDASAATFSSRAGSLCAWHVQWRNPQTSHNGVNISLRPIRRAVLL